MKIRAYNIINNTVCPVIEIYFLKALLLIKSLIFIYKYLHYQCSSYAGFRINVHFITVFLHTAESHTFAESQRTGMLVGS